MIFILDITKQLMIISLINVSMGDGSVLAGIYFSFDTCLVNC